MAQISIIVTVEDIQLSIIGRIEKNPLCTKIYKSHMIITGNYSQLQIYTAMIKKYCSEVKIFE